MAKPKRIVFISDLHCGSHVGLRSDPQNATQRGLLARYAETIAMFGKKPDVLVLNGDASDGQHLDSDMQTTNIPWQIEEAEELLMMWQPKSIVIVEGTAFHTGDTVAFEKFLAGYVARRGTKTTYCIKFRARVNGWFKLQARHKVGRSMVPYGVHTAPAREQTNQVLNAAIEARHKREPLSWPHLSVFGHVHYWSYAETAQGAVVTLPAWKAIGDRYGDKECSGRVDIGAFQIFVQPTEQGGWTWERRLYPSRLESRTVDI